VTVDIGNAVSRPDWVEDALENLKEGLAIERRELVDEQPVVLLFPTMKMGLRWL